MGGRRHLWKRVRVPASECPRISPAFLAEEGASMGDYYFAQEYECSFEASDAQLIPEETLRKMWRPACAPPLFPKG